MPSSLDASSFTRSKRLEVTATVSASNADAPFVKNDGKAGYIPTNNCVVPPYIPPIIFYKYKELTPVAGVLNDNSATVNGSGTNAKFQSMSAIFAIGKDIYLVDRNSFRIRKYNETTNQVTTYIGPDSVGSPTIQTNLINYPNCIAYDESTQTMFIGQYQDEILKVNMRTNTVTKLTFAVSGVTNPICGAMVFTDGMLYCIDVEKDFVYRVNPTTLETAIIAGSPGVPGDKDGFGTQARFRTSTNGLYCNAITVDSKKNLYIADRTNHKIRKINLRAFEVSTVLDLPFAPIVVLYSPIDDALYYAGTYQISKMYLKRTSDNVIVNTNDDGLTSLAVTSVNTLYDASSRFVLYKYS
jgi:hypothetical protein